MSLINVLCNIRNTSLSSWYLISTITGPPFSPAGPGGPWGPERPDRPMGPAGPAAPLSPGEPYDNGLFHIFDT